MEKERKRHRRTAEERLAELERKRIELLEKQQVALAKIEEEKRRLVKKPILNKMALENQKRFERTVRAIAPDLDHRHFVAIIAEALVSGIDQEAMAQKGEGLLELHGKTKRGRRPRAVAA